MALSTMAVFGSAFFTPIVVGKIADTIGWEWSFKLVAIFAGVLLPFVFFLVPETAFVRNAALNTDITGTTKARPFADESQHGYNSSSELTTVQLDQYGKQQMSTSTQAMPSSTISPSPQPRRSSSYWSTLSPFSGRKTDDSFLLLLVRPIALFAQPSVFWACLTQGTLIGWTVLIGIVLAAIFLAPPLYFTAHQVGYMYSSAFIGALLGFVVCGALSDWSAKWLMKRNGGVFEPEFRLVLVLPQLVFGCGGLFAFGITSNDLIRYALGIILSACRSTLQCMANHVSS